MLEKIKELCRINGTSIGKLEKTLGFGHATIFKWEHSLPRSDKLKDVADYFGVTVDYLLSNSDISPEAMMMAQKFDNLSKNQQQAVSKVLNSYSFEVNKEDII